MITEKNRKLYLAIFKLSRDKLRCRCGGQAKIIDILDQKDHYLLVNISHIPNFENATLYSKWIWDIETCKFLIDGQSLVKDANNELEKFNWKDT